ncbi:MAG TPA: hypothetical protein IGS53_22705 [Leptolyngbyaceae cyanobacterium M33_DOE_097]|uniref:Uncharacterized protein n=1 Tax=Oscillatoriales cyanobacterium SpSt-418 TaxID=2282169 RepID=A0A7C3PHI3_9CYAN|nr:hypothetical protein [Leptolyngbyaceae cyanobacterium M33_DOE_097]
MKPMPSLPMRAIIRCKVKQQMLADVDVTEMCMPVDEPLLKDLTNSLFGSSYYLQRFSNARSQDEIETISNEMATEVLMTYRQIMMNATDPMIQKLNDLLSD